MLSISINRVVFRKLNKDLVTSPKMIRQAAHPTTQCGTHVANYIGLPYKTFLLILLLIWVRKSKCAPVIKEQRLGLEVCHPGSPWGGCLGVARPHPKPPGRVYVGYNRPTLSRCAA